MGAVFEGRSVVKLSDLLRFLRGLEPTSGPPEEGEQAGSARRGGPKHRERDGGRPPEHIPFPGPTESGPASQHPRDRALGCLSSPPRSTTPPGPPPLRNVGAPSPAPHLTEGRLLWDTHACPPPPPLWRVPLCCGVWLPPHTPPRGARMTLLKQCPGSAHPSGQLLVPCAHGWCGETYSLLWSNEAGGVERAGNRGIAVRGCHRGTDVPKTEKEYSKRSTRTVI